MPFGRKDKQEAKPAYPPKGPPPDELEGTPPARRYQRALGRKWPRWHPTLYVNACRRIAGSSAWSQHAWGNAVDVMCSGDRQVDVARWTHANAEDLDVATIIYQSKVWSWEQPWWRAYGGQPHVSHVHVDFRPPRTGTPPCAP